MSKQKQQEPAAEQEKLPDYGLSQERLNELIPLEDRADPDNPDTASAIADISEESLKKYYPHLIVYPTPRLPKMTRRSAYAITHGHAKRKEISAA